jgi:hypothetical protein
MWKLQMRRAEKIGIAVAMSMGVLYFSSHIRITSRINADYYPLVLGELLLSRLSSSLILPLQIYVSSDHDLLSLGRDH